MERIKQAGFTILKALIAIVAILGAVGWIWNIFKIAQSDFVLTGLFILRLIGVFVAPLGAIVGYF